MIHMLAATLAILRQDQLISHSPLILCRGVIALLTSSALELNNRPIHFVLFFPERPTTRSASK